jgi:tripartite-type tricarboxylate transporter receptor subunit TctC
MKTVAPALAVALSVASIGAAHAQAYPTKPIRFVTPFPAGANPDIVARAIAQKLTAAWGKPVIVDNRPGAGGVIGLESVVKAPADGHTLLLGTAGVITIAPSLYKLPYDTVRDFDPVTMLAYVPNILVVHPSVPAKSIKDLIALAKGKPGTLGYSSSGSGTPAHLAGEVFKTLAGVNLVHVPYKGSPQAMTALLGAEVAMMFSPVPLALPHVKTGKLRVLGVTTLKRSPVVPEIAPIAESGVPGYEVVQWYALFVRVGTPRDIVNHLNAEVARILKMPDVSAKLASQGSDPVASTPEELGAYVKAELAKWARVVKDSGATAD